MTYGDSDKNLTIPNIEECTFYKDTEKCFKSSDNADSIQYTSNRFKMIDTMRNEGRPFYPHKFHVTMSIPKYCEEYVNLENGEVEKDKVVSLAGRITSIRSASSKLIFYDIVGEDKKVQIIANLLEHDNTTGNFNQVHSEIRRGDVVGVIGNPGRSRRGELSLFIRNILLLSPCYHMLPTAISGLKDQEIRYRQRYLDLILNEDSRRVFKLRSRALKFIRNFFDNLGCLEVETPMMNLIYSGASARPFITYHNELNTQLYMRIAPELYLKQLIIGGFDRVYEIGKNFRNEGIDLTHNPEFTAVEVYIAYADYYDLMDMTEELISGLVMEINGKLQIEYNPDGTDREPVIIDFTRPWKRYSFVEEIETAIGQSLLRPLNGQDNIKFMLDICKEYNIEVPQPQTAAKLLDKLAGHFIEIKCHNPSFIIDHPQTMSPLAKWHRSKAEVTERFELFILGKELCNAYTELNEPRQQRTCFEEQVKSKELGDIEACPIDETFCLALEHGLPPTGGWGLGIDRLIMLLANKNNIKEVILFPAMKPMKQNNQGHHNDLFVEAENPK
ncbi:lysyl-tRNA synthetase family protein [Cryptosporidium andersoni]|uniref:Lysine--tRNA ligase n=1 Tax=Cryptosporidium andersoni TaxID=117008 RepID=A0A1J4MX74_9CRYT|nr:lysyl-tRNA synthetase family protein [Cryptosporidium andersoni]